MNIDVKKINLKGKECLKYIGKKEKYLAGITDLLHKAEIDEVIRGLIKLTDKILKKKSVRRVIKISEDLSLAKKKYKWYAKKYKKFIKGLPKREKEIDTENEKTSVATRTKKASKKEKKKRIRELKERGKEYTKYKKHIDSGKLYVQVEMISRILVRAITDLANVNKDVFKTLTLISCSNCGAISDGGAKSCEYCGGKFKKKKKK